MTDEADLSVSENPGGLSEPETLARLTIDEKRKLAYDATIEFPHFSSFMPEQLENNNIDVSYSASPHEKTEALMDEMQHRVESGEDKEALDRYIYGHIDEATVYYCLGVDPDEVADRDPLAVWDGVYDGV